MLTDPIAEYSHTEGFSVTGGFVYRGITLSPTWLDVISMRIMLRGRSGAFTRLDEDPDTWSTPELELDTGFNISAFGEDEGGEIYLADYHWGNDPPPD